MQEAIYFMPLGGGQQVGASCYYLRLDNINIILDAGTGWSAAGTYTPDLHALKTSPFLQSMSQINHIFISHAHLDHIGFLPELMQQAPHASIYMTELTKTLTDFQLRNMRTKRRREKYDAMLIQALNDRICTVSYTETVQLGGISASFYPAGHIPGAMMTLFDTGKRQFLYTGDYSTTSTPLVDGYFLPDDVDIDTIIMCGLHALHPYYRKQENELDALAETALELACAGQSCMCHTSQLSKTVEFLKALNEKNTYGIDIYIDYPIMQLVEKLERQSIPLITPHNKTAAWSVPPMPHIVLTTEAVQGKIWPYKHIPVDFALHEDFAEMQHFIKKLNPRQVALVHCAKPYNPQDETIEQRMLQDFACRTQFIFAENGMYYQF